MKPLDPRLLRYSAAARGYLAVTVGLGLAATGLILIQASLLARILAGTVTGTGVSVLAGSLGVLLAVLLARAAAGYGGETAALRAAAAVKSQLRRRLTDHALRLGPSWLALPKPAGHRSGEVTTLATRGLDALDAYFARYLPQLVLACIVPVAVLIRVGFADWISAVVIGLTLPLIPVFAILVGLHTKATTQRQWRLLARLGGHFLDVVEGLPTLKLFGRGKRQAEVIGKVTDEYRTATMASLRVAFLSGFVLELAAALATALVAVEVGLRLLAGHMSYRPRCSCCCSRPRPICRCARSAPSSTPAPRAPPRPRMSSRSSTPPRRRPLCAAARPGRWTCGQTPSSSAGSRSPTRDATTTRCPG